MTRGLPRPLNRALALLKAFSSSSRHRHPISLPESNQNSPAPLILALSPYKRHPSSRRTRIRPNIPTSRSKGTTTTPPKTILRLWLRPGCHRCRHCTPRCHEDCGLYINNLVTDVLRSKSRKHLNELDQFAALDSQEIVYRVGEDPHQPPYLAKRGALSSIAS